MTTPITNLHNEPDIVGSFTRAQGAGMALNGSRMHKIESDAGDAHGDGALCTVLGSCDAGYFVIWDDTPGVACFIAVHRLTLVELQ